MTRGTSPTGSTRPPTQSQPARRASDIARQVVEALLTHGVEHAVLSPGSRSTPLALELHAAAREGRLTVHVRIDERSAGFLALGLTRHSRRPVPVVTTSGTAVANLLPAVMEAHHSGHPLVVLSADRPDHVRGTGANQTTWQAGIFGRFAPCHDLPRDVSPEAVATAIDDAARRSGPTQVNLQFDGPLTPTGPRDSSSSMNGPAPTLTTTTPTTRVTDHAPGELLRLGPRTVVVAGDDAGPPARLLAEAAGWPLLAEPTSGARTGPNAIRTHRLLLRTSVAEQIERVVVLGHPTLSRPVTELISRPDLDIVSVRGRTSGVVTDPGHVARHLDAEPRVDGPDDPAWLARWTAADAAVSIALDARLPSDTGPLSALSVAREVAQAVGPGGTLVVGSSKPVRDLDVMGSPWPPQEHRFVVGMRGLAGIDGVVSFAVGVALGRPRANRSLALVGDITFLHDANALTIGPAEPRPDLTIVVLNDDGGAIFAPLEQGAPEFADAFERFFATPHGTDIGALCRAHGIEHHVARTVAALRDRLHERPEGIVVVEVPVSRADRRRESTELVELARAVVDGGVAGGSGER